MATYACPPPSLALRGATVILVPSLAKTCNEQASHATPITQRQARATSAGHIVPSTHPKVMMRKQKAHLNEVAGQSSISKEQEVEHW